MTTAITLPEGAPEEVITNALVRDVDLAPFGFQRLTRTHHFR